jgi:hypothetical protein
LLFVSFSVTGRAKGRARSAEDEVAMDVMERIGSDYHVKFVDVFGKRRTP